MNDPGVATYIVDRNINYTNVCVYRCQFCAFYRPSARSIPRPTSSPSTRSARRSRRRSTSAARASSSRAASTRDLPFSFYEDMFRFIRKTFPTIHLHALSAPEIYFLQKITKWPLRDVISRLRDAGLQSIPGGGAEILEDSVRKRIWSLTKAPTEKWVDVHEVGPRPRHAHDGDDDVRRRRDLRAARRALPRACATCRTARAASPRGSPGRSRRRTPRSTARSTIAGGFEYLKTLAVSRLYFDNIRHVQGSWVTQGPKIGQVSLSFGADDLGSIMIEENVVFAAGARNRMTREEMRRIIRDAGYEPAQRRTLYDACTDFCCTSPIPPPKAGAGRGLPVLPGIDSSVVSA